MNWAHVHLMLNHIPVIGIAVGALLLLLAVVRKSDELKRAGMGILVVTALLAIPVFLTGEPAEEVVERLPGVSERLIESHESAGLIALIMAGLTGIAGLTGLLISRAKAVSKPLVLVTLLLALATSGVMAWTANLGGQIRHTEIRSPSNSTAPSTTPGEQDRRGEESEFKEGHRED